MKKFEMDLRGYRHTLKVVRSYTTYLHTLYVTYRADSGQFFLGMVWCFQLQFNSIRFSNNKVDELDLYSQLSFRKPK